MRSTKIKQFFWVALVLLAAVIIGGLRARATSRTPAVLPREERGKVLHRAEVQGEASGSSPGVIYVDRDAGGANDGSSWANAYNSLAAALGAAGAGDEVWVAAGVYTPTTGITRTVTFQLVDGVALYGGFAGTETRRQERDWEAHLTVLSGDIDGDDVTDANGVITHTGAIFGTNAFHVVSAAGVTDAAVLDGFTITGGQAVGSGEDGNGGGIYSAQGSPTLRHLIVRGNCAGICGTYSAGRSLPLTDAAAGDERQDGDTVTAWLARAAAGQGRGGGMYAASASPVLSYVTFSHNEAAAGGGMQNAENSAPVLTDVVFTDNGAASGGGMHNDSSAPALTDVAFIRNRANLGGAMYNGRGTLSAVNATLKENEAIPPIGKGGGMYNDASSVTVANAIFQANRVEGYPMDPPEGGALYSGGGSLVLINATVYENETDSSGVGGGLYGISSDLTLANSILWGNSDGTGVGETAQITATSDSGVTVTYSLLQGAATYAGPGVINEDPRFADAPGDLRLGPDSPAIDAGDNGVLIVSSDLDGGPRRVDVAAVPDTGRGSPPIVDMGAYEVSFEFYVPLVSRRW